MVAGLSEGARTAFVIVLLSAATIGATWAYTLYAGPLQDETPPHLLEPRIFLVDYPTETTTMVTEVVWFTNSGVASFQGMRIDIRNVTMVDITLQVTMEGPAVNDEFTVEVVDPVGGSISGSHTVPQPSTAGYIRSDTVISWRRMAEPEPESYRTEDREEAARWSAENHTDTSTEGDWAATVTLNQPLYGREGNVSLLMRFIHFEAIVLPQSPSQPTTVPEDSDTPQNTTAGNRTPRGGDSGSMGASMSRSAGTAPTGPASAPSPDPRSGTRLVRAGRGG